MTNDKRLKIEGSASSQLVQLMRKLGDNDKVTVEIASVVSPSPSIMIELGDGIELSRSELIMTRQASNLTYERGEQVIVICLNDKMQYFVIDKAVM